MHVVYRMNCWVAELRTRGLFHVFRKVLAFYLACSDFRVVHISIQKNHLHLLVEASDRGALRRGLTSFASRAARALNRSLGTSGKIFKHRYHATQITTPRQARNSLAYVLNNWRRHNLDITKAGQISYPIDLYSSALAFTGWSTRVAPRLPAEYVPLPVSPPKTDLLRWDYRRYGLIDPFETPGPIW